MKNKNRSSALTMPAQQRKSGEKKWIFLSLGLAATGALSYFGWQYWKKHKGAEDNAATDYTASSYTTTSTTASSTTATTPISVPSTYTTPTPSNDFPIKKGSKGAIVKALQQALINSHGKAILPKYGADGDFGTETVNALIKLKLPQIIDETTFNVIVNPQSLNATDVAAKIFAAANKKDYASAIKILKTLKSTSDYSAVSKELVDNYRFAGVHQTLVNAMLNTFTSETQKQEIRLAFAAMGLKYDGDKWALSGLNDLVLITNQATKVWKNPQTSVPVPAKMVLGRMVAKRANFIMFENEGQYFLVEGQHVSNYKTK